MAYWSVGGSLNHNFFTSLTIERRPISAVGWRSIVPGAASVRRFAAKAILTLEEPGEFPAGHPDHWLCVTCILPNAWP